MRSRRLAWGLALLAVAAGFGICAGCLWAWQEQLWAAGKVVYFIVSGTTLVFWGLLLSGLSAAAGLWCLIRPMLMRITRKPARVFVRILVYLCVGSAFLVWLYFWFISGAISIAATYHKVTADTGESVVVVKPGFDPASFDIYVPKSAVVFERIKGISGVAESGRFVPDHCTLAKQDADLILNCTNDVTILPNTAN
ncbi:hypothetical protein GA0061084_2480 [Arthrobacter sp. NIO-1057]|nr:hypothetical protein GA0061084_2480 [Arthrobacter sp. NIO-1057]